MEVKNIQTNSQTNFQALKSIRYKGLYKKYPQEAEKLKNALLKNPVAMDFVKMFDVDVIIEAEKVNKHLSTSVRLDYLNPMKSRLFGLFNIKDIVLAQVTHCKEVEDMSSAIKDATDSMIPWMSSRKRANGEEFGTLNLNIKKALNEMGIKE